MASAVAAAIRKVSQWVELAPHGDRGRLSLGACTISVSQADQARGHPEGAENQPGAVLALDTKMRERGVGDQDLQRMEMRKQEGEERKVVGRSYCCGKAVNGTYWDDTARYTS